MKLRKPWVIAGAAALLAALLLGLWLQSSGPSRPEASAAPVGAKAQEAGPAGQSLDQLLAAGQRAQADAATAGLPNRFDVCGGRSFDPRTEQAAIIAVRKEIAARGHDVISQAGIRLAARSDPTERAAGLWAQYAAENSRWTRGLQGVRKGNVEIIQVPPAPSQVANPLGALVRFAAESRHPDALRFALGACASLRPAPKVCESISWAQLAAAEPDNAANWLSAAAQSREGSPEQVAALQRAAAAPYFRTGTSQAPGVLARQLEGLGDAPAQQAALLLMTAVHVGERLHRPEVLNIDARCADPKATALDDTGRAACVSLAQRLARSDDLMLAMRGLSMQALFAVSPGESATLLAQRDALQQAANRVTEETVAAGPYACRAIAGMRQHMIRVGQIGEAGVAREQLARERAQNAAGAGQATDRR
jgi:hypothetical protein